MWSFAVGSLNKLLNKPTWSLFIICLSNYTNSQGRSAVYCVVVWYRLVLLYHWELLRLNNCKTNATVPVKYHRPDTSIVGYCDLPMPLKLLYNLWIKSYESIKNWWYNHNKTKHDKPVAYFIGCNGSGLRCIQSWNEGCDIRNCIP